MCLLVGHPHPLAMNSVRVLQVMVLLPVALDLHLYQAVVQIGLDFFWIHWSSLSVEFFLGVVWDTCHRVEGL